MWEPQGRIIADTFLPQGISRHMRVPRHGRMLRLWVLQPGLIARDHHRSTGGQANAGSFLYNLSAEQSSQRAQLVSFTDLEGISLSASVRLMAPVLGFLTPSCPLLLRHWG